METKWAWRKRLTFEFSAVLSLIRLTPAHQCVDADVPFNRVIVHDSVRPPPLQVPEKGPPLNPPVLLFLFLFFILSVIAFTFLGIHSLVDPLPQIKGGVRDKEKQRERERCETDREKRNRCSSPVATVDTDSLCAQLAPPTLTYLAQEKPQSPPTIHLLTA